MRQCRNCEELVKRLNGGFCKPSCKRDYRKKLNRQDGIDESVTSGTLGALRELQVSVDLLKKGYHVFRALSPASPCDLIIMKDSRLLRAEVTTGKRTGQGKVTFVKHDSTRYDILIIVFRDGEIIYVPDLANLV